MIPGPISGRAVRFRDLGPAVSASTLVYLIPVLMLILMPIPGVSAFELPDYLFSGYVESRHSVRARTPNETLASETMARLELTAYAGEATLFASGDLSENHLMGEASGISLHEAYMDICLPLGDLPPLDIRLGRQIIIWGAADGVRITDNISPADYSEYITRSFDEIRMAVDALNLKWATDKGTAQLIWIPFYKSGVLPSLTSPWSLSQNAPNQVPGMEEPDPGFENSEVAAKYALFLPGADLAFSYFYTWNDNPVFEPVSLLDGSTAFRPFYHRIHIFGAEISKPWNDFVFRAEAAFLHGHRFTTQGAPKELAKKDLIQKDLVKWLVGLDWYPGNNWTLTTQFSREEILSPDGNLGQRPRTNLATLTVSKKLFREKLTLSGTAYLDPDLKDSLTRISGEYRVTDTLSLFLGSDLFFGDRSGRFGRYRDNTGIWTKIKYYF